MGYRRLRAVGQELQMGGHGGGGAGWPARRTSLSHLVGQPLSEGPQWTGPGLRPEGKIPSTGRRWPLAKITGARPQCLRFPTRLPAKVVQATVHFFTRLEVCKNY